MRINEYNNLDEFLSQYTGVWGPSEGHWFGLDFKYHEQEYRFHTGSMYGREDTTDENGVVHQFGLYKKVLRHNRDYYELLSEDNSIEKILNSTAIEGVPFREVIMDDSTELLGQD